MMRNESSKTLVNLGLLIDELDAQALPLGDDIRESVWRRLVDLAHQLPLGPPAEAWRAQTLMRLRQALVDWRDALRDHVSAPQLTAAVGLD